MLFGRSQANLPSRFLKEIPEELLETPAKSKRQTITSKSTTSSNVVLVNVRLLLKTSICFRLEGRR